MRWFEHHRAARGRRRAVALAFFGWAAFAVAPLATAQTSPQGQAEGQAQGRGQGRAKPADSGAPRHPIAASALDVELSWKEYDDLVLDRHGSSEIGLDALRHLVRARLLDRLATESGLRVNESEIDAKWSELERSVIASGEAANLQEYLQKKRVGRAKLREFLRLAIVQETLSRAALGVPAGRTVNGEQQEMWLDQIVQQRGMQLVPAPWPDGVAARCGDLEVRVADYLAHLKEQLASEDIRDDCYQALLAKRMRARMPDLSPEAWERALEAELVRRRTAIESDPEYKGLKLEQVLASQGMSMTTLRRDPAVTISALSYLWVDRAHGEEGLRKVYADERAEFDRKFGEAREARVLFLRGARFTNELNPRTFEDAERELERIKPQIRSREDFERFARARSEDTATRESGGSIGFVSPGDENVPEPIRSVVFAAAPKETPEHVAGPVRITSPSGAVLVWVGGRRPAPGWDEMRARVHNELRRRFLDECLLRKDVVTYLDRD
jgi:hypothetical protein